ncbi:hypothetical protein QWY82_10180 [Simiduia curdlanivorans]|uniref:Uncharacterized protein n=1 Tax=Simiduia curdlanivorans TaxID=1492769 RepID=A0ABV8UZ72_9GAMM|nr:hypothetical protein [Simiduia curdlanivorans]MDN3639177.1 hypothetical protein [Simiduia curdlanivorans]
MKCILNLILASLVYSLAACGGGGGGGGGSSEASTSISLSTSQVAFTTETYQRDKKAITANFKGDGVVVGTPPGVALPSWLAVEEVSTSASTVVFNVIVEYPSTVGTYTATLRFVTGKSNGDEVTYKDLDVALTVVAPSFISTVSGNSPLPPTQQLSLGSGINGADYSATINYGQPPVSNWLDLTLSGTTFTVAANTTDLTPGDYTAILNFKANGKAETVRTVNYHVAAPTLTHSPISSLTIGSGSSQSELITSTQISSNSSALSWELTGQSGLLSAQLDYNANRIDISVDPSTLAEKANGNYQEWIEVTYTHPALPAPTTTRIDLEVVLAFTDLKYATPLVSYQNEPTKVVLWGDNLDQLTEQQLSTLLEGLGSYTRVNANEIELQINTNLSAGSYPLQVNNLLGLNRSAAQIIVRAKPNFPVGELTLQRKANQVIYDAQREKFYVSEGYGSNAIYSLSHDNTGWSWSALPIENPASMALTRDGSQLIVGTYECSVWEIDLGQLLITQPNGPTDCYYDYYGAINQFYNGLTVIADTNQWPSMYSYPSWGAIPFDLPSEHSPEVVFSEQGTHMIWAGGPTISSAQTAYVYNARTNVMNILNTVGDRYYLQSLFSISADGSRIAHFNDIYDAQLHYLGALGDLTRSSTDKVGISPDGNNAAIFVEASKSIRIFDISSPAGIFIESSPSISLDASMTRVQNIVFSRDNAYLFVFADSYDTNISKMYVYKL